MQLLQYTASISRGTRQCKTSICTATVLRSNGYWNSCNALPHCLGAGGSATPVMHCLRACGRWVVELLLCTATVCWGSGLRNSSNELPHCMVAVGSGTSAMYRLSACGQWAVELLLCTATLPGGNGPWSAYNALPQRLGAVGGATLAIHCLKIWGQGAVQLLHLHCQTAKGPWALELLQCTASLPGGSGQRNSCNALPHRFVGGG